MSENELYINAYLNSISNTLMFYVERIKSIGSKTSEYYFCVSQVLDLIEMAEERLKQLKIDKICTNRFFNLLMLLYDYNIPQVTDILNKYSYLSSFKRDYDIVREKIREDLSLDNEDVDLMNFMLSSGLIPTKHKDKIYPYFITKTLIRDSSITLNAFKKMIVDYAQRLLSTVINNGHIIIQRPEESDGNVCIYYNGTIYLDECKIEEMYSVGGYQILIDIFQGVRMAFHDLNMGKKNCDDLTIKMIKDTVLSELYPEYVADNKQRMPFYAETQIYAYNAIMDFFQRRGIPFYKDKNPYIDEIQQLKINMIDNKRTIEGSDDNLDYLFDFSVEYMPELLDIYPSLARIYEVEGNHLKSLKSIERRIT